MKMRKSKVLVLALTVSVIAILSLGSLAWFSDEDTVTNTIQFEDKKGFSVDVYETDESGAAVMDDGETIGRNYTNIMPGQKIHKDPTVWNDGDHPEWVRVSVTLSSYKVWETKIKAGTDLSTIFGGYKDSLWTRVDTPVVDQEANTVTYTFYLNKPLAAGSKVTLFKSVTIPGEIDMGDVSDMSDGAFTIDVKAEAIQSEYLPEGVDSAIEAFALLAEDN